MELFEALANRRRIIKMSFEDLSTASRVPVSTLKKIFTGVTANPPFETVRSIAYAMGISTDDLIDSMEKPSDTCLSPAALSIARRYDVLDEHSKKVVDAVVDLESKRPSGYASETARFNAMADLPSTESSAR